MSMGSGGIFGNGGPFALPDMPIGITPTQFSVPKAKGKGGMFGGGFGQALPAILSAISAATGSPLGMASMQLLQQRLGQKREDQQYEQRRQAELQDYGKKLEMQAQYKAPDVPDIMERIQVLESIKPGLGKTYAQNYAQNGGGLGSLFRDPATGQAYMMPQGLPPLGEEMDDPRKQGGPSPLGSGGFPGSF